MQACNTIFECLSTLTTEGHFYEIYTSDTVEQYKLNFVHSKIRKLFVIERGLRSLKMKDEKMQVKEPFPLLPIVIFVEN